MLLPCVEHMRRQRPKSANAARDHIVSAAKERWGIHFTGAMIKKWDDRFRRPDDATDAADTRPDAYAAYLIDAAKGDTQQVIEIGMAWIWKWWSVPRLPEVPPG
jgi:hypothetical protein